MTAKSKTTKTRATPAVTASRSAAAEQRAWQAKDDLRTIQQAQQIQNDKTRMAAAQKEATNQLKALQSIAKK